MGICPSLLKQPADRAHWRNAANPDAGLHSAVA
jgi:hypothetical protein